jgi:hypothetical protein
MGADRAARRRIGTRKGRARVDRQAYIELLLDHYENPRNRGKLADADVVLGGGNPGCGDVVTIYPRSTTRTASRP